MGLEILTSIFSEMVTVSSGLLADTAISVGNYSGSITNQFASGVECALLYSKSGAGELGATVGEKINPRTWLKEDQDQTIVNNIYASLPGTDYDPLGLENLTSGANNR
jgi:hypothetical protein